MKTKSKKNVYLAFDQSFGCSNMVMVEEELMLSSSCFPPAAEDCYPYSCSCSNADRRSILNRLCPLLSLGFVSSENKMISRCHNSHDAGKLAVSQLMVEQQR